MASGTSGDQRIKEVLPGVEGAVAAGSEEWAEMIQVEGVASGASGVRSVLI